LAKNLPHVAAKRRRLLFQELEGRQMLTSYLFDLNHSASPAAAGYTGVLPTTTYSAALGYGWITPLVSTGSSNAGAFDRGALSGTAHSDLLRDGHWAGWNDQFQVDLLAGVQYEVTMTFGDGSFARDQIHVTVPSGYGSIISGASQVTGVATAAGSFTSRTFTVEPGAAGQLRLQLSDGGGDPYWVLNSIVIRDSVVALEVTAPGGALPADNTTVDTFQVSGATPGALYTVSSTLGTVVQLNGAAIADADSRYGGLQIAAPAETFELGLQRPTAMGTATLSLSEVSGAARGTATQHYTVAAQRRYDFNGAGSDTADGFIGVRGSDTYTPARGYGWTASAQEFERTASGISAAPAALYRDGHYASNQGARTFRVQVDGAAYTFRAHVGDRSFARDNIILYVGPEGIMGSPGPITVAANQFVVVEFGAQDINGDGAIEFTIYDNGGDPYWVINGVEVLRNNRPPDAQDDGGPGFITDEDTPFDTANVLANDSDPDGPGTFTIVSFDTTGTLGLVTHHGDGTFHYDPSGQFNHLLPGQTASDTFRYTIRDNDGATDTATVTVTVTGVNDAPVVINPLADVNVDEDAPDTIISVLGAFSDAENPQTSLVYFAYSNNSSLVSTHFDDQTGDLILRYFPDAFGSTLVTVTAYDSGGLSVDATFRVTVNPVNDAPFALPVEVIWLNEDPQGTTLSLPWELFFYDVDGLVEDLTLTFVGSTDANIAIATIDSVAREVRLHVLPDAHGLATVTIRATDAGNLASTNDLSVLVNGAPQVSTPAGVPVVVDEDAVDTILSAYDLFDDDIDNDDDLFYEIEEVINEALFREVNLDWVTGALTLSYTPNAHGVSMITLRAWDSGGLSAVTTFTVTVNAVNDVPTTSGLANVTLTSDAPLAYVDLWQAFQDLEDGRSSLVYSVSYMDPDPDHPLLTELPLPDADGFLTLRAVPGAVGTAPITVRATDSNGAFVEATFTLEVDYSDPPAPYVWLLANNDASEGGAIGGFTLLRSGDLSRELTVGYTTSGKALNGVDYNSLSGQVTFAVGARQAMIQVTAIDDAKAEGNETLTITLLAPPVEDANAYQPVASASLATIMIADNDATSAFYQVPGRPGDTADVTFTFTGADAGYSNILGYYFVQNEDGVVNGVAPGSAGYSPSLVELFRHRSPDQPGAARTVTFASGTYLAFYLVQNGVNTAGPKFYSFKAANFDNQTEHFAGGAIAGNGDTYTAGVEDLTNGGDLDYNDFQFRVSAVTHHTTSTASTTVDLSINGSVAPDEDDIGVFLSVNEHHGPRERILAIPLDANHDPNDGAILVGSLAIDTSPYMQMLGQLQWTIPGNVKVWWSRDGAWVPVSDQDDYISGGSETIYVEGLLPGDSRILAEFIPFVGPNAHDAVAITITMPAYEVTDFIIEERLPDGSWVPIQEGDVLWKGIEYRWIPQFSPFAPQHVDRIEWFARPWDDPAAPRTPFGNVLCDCPTEADPGVGDWAIDVEVHFGSSFVAQLPAPKREALLSYTVQWVGYSHPGDGKTNFERRGNDKEYGGGDRIFAERNVPRGQPNDEIHNKVSVKITLNAKFPEGIAPATLFLKAFDPDHYHSHLDADPGGNDPNDNRGSNGEVTDQVGGTLADITLIFRPGDQVKDTTFEIFGMQPGNNFLATVQASQVRIDAVGFATDGTTLVNSFNGKPIAEYNRGWVTDLLTVWRTLWIERDAMRPPAAGDGPFNGDPACGAPDFKKCDDPHPGKLPLGDPRITEAITYFRDAQVRVMSVPLNLDRRDGARFNHNMDFFVSDPADPLHFEIYTIGRSVRDVANEVDFWVIQILHGYEGDSNLDHDPDTEISANLGSGSGEDDGPSWVYIEVIRDVWETRMASGQVVVPLDEVRGRIAYHELLHHFNLAHDLAAPSPPGCGDQGVLSKSYDDFARAGAASGKLTPCQIWNIQSIELPK
jgi:VCBS repeat-containing protein